ncbi:hypothetical protein AB0M05_28050 [Streptomyces violaceusniger]|uniref:hypothetical protein n=1 Tax=Streptomyces violaceusniger TaxID=68280 RepID=UPI0034312FA6
MLSTRTAVLRVLGGRILAPRIVHEVKEWYAVSALVAAGPGICLLPRMVPLPPHWEMATPRARQGDRRDAIRQGDGMLVTISGPAADA